MDIRRRAPAVWVGKVHSDPSSAQLGFPDGLGNQSWTYTKDGLPATITTYNGSNATWPWVNAYHYNKRRLLDGQGDSISQPGWYTWALGYGYDRNGNLATQTYPTGLTLSYAPNALGQATQVGSNQGTYASGVSYYPNGAVKQFTYGNGLVHSMWQNARQLPWTVSDGGVSGFSYTYDKNGNPTQIDDNAQGASFNRYLSYDGLDRLTAAGSAMFGGSTHYINYAYDPIDNLRSVSHPGVREHTYWYDAKNQLTNVRNAGGATVTGLGYDVQGNLNNKNGQDYWFSYGNRLRSVVDKETYAYDGLGRRVQTMQADGTVRLFQYSQAGQYMFGSTLTPAGAQTTQENIYLGGSLIATVDHNWPSNTIIATKYHHTDALGSPVATTDTSGTVIERTNYEPYGNPINKTVDGIGYTGHVMDGATGLTYMQQRYYDPTLGRFLSVDPVSANPNTGALFGRYMYAANNPYRFFDPDGRCTGSRIENSDGTCQGTGGYTTESSTVPTRADLNRAMNAQPQQPRTFGETARREVGKAWDEFTDKVLPAVAPPEAAAVGGAKLLGAGLLAIRLGKAGEDAVRATYAIGGRELIYVNGRLRIPDGINLAMKTVSEVKNVSYQAYTRQLRDYVDYARANGMQFNLFVRPGAQLSAPLEAAVRSGEVALKVIP